MAVAKAERYRFRHFGPDDGLNTAISVILQDRTGFLWVGTGNGLFRYDGARFQRFGLQEGLPSSSIRRLHQSPDGTFWAATAGGLARLRQERFETVDLGISGYNLDLHALASGNGKIYVGLDQGMVSGTLGTDRSPGFHREPGVPKVPVWGIHVDHGGAVWFSSEKRLCRLERGAVRVFDESDGLPAQRWGAMLRDRRGNLWIRGPQHLFVWHAETLRFVSRDEGLPQSSNTILTLAQDSRGTIMVATDQGLARWIDGRWQLTGTAQGLESDSVTSVFEDRENSLWIGMWGAGLARWPGSTEWTNWTIADGLTSNVVWAIRRDPGGSVWVGTDRGLLRMDSGVVRQSWSQKDGLGGDKVKALAIADDGAVWAGCLPGGVSRLDPRTGRIRTYGRKSGLDDDRVSAIHIDSENRLWASTGEGLYRSSGLGPDLFFERQVLPGLPERTMYFRLLTDHSGALWVGSSQALYRWEAGRWSRFTTENGLKSNSVSHIAETRDGAIWIAYREPVGLSKLIFRKDRVQIEHVTGKDGLPSEYALFLGLDSTGRLWVGTDNGLAVKEGTRWVVHTHEDGLVWDDCAANAFTAEPDGTVWIGTLKGLSRYHPGSKTAAAPPPPIVRNVKFGERPANPAAFSEVPYWGRDFSVSFSALSFLTEEHMRFRYRLLGLDDRWIETSLRETRYPSLPPGSYRFEVAARNANSDWSAPAATLAFTIAPPWWGTWWFRILTAGGLAALVWMALRVRVGQMIREHRQLESAVRERTRELELQKDVVERQKREIEELLRQSEEVSRLKSEFLANMSHEIRTPMNGVMGMTQLVLGTPLDEEQREYINTVRESAQRLLVVINDILDFSKIEAGKMELARDRFSVRKCVTDALQVFSWKAREKGIDLRQEIAPDVPEMVMGDADRLRQILLNLVANAMNFTEHGSVSLTVTADGTADAREFRFSVRDTGAGIPFDKQDSIFEAFEQADGSATRRKGGTGLGLAICSKLVRLMQGRIWVESTLNRGSTFSFTLPCEVAGSLETAWAGRDTRGPKTADDLVVPMAAVSLRILLAEDNAVNQLVATRMIQKMGHTLVVVEDGRQAAQMALEGQFDLILMDVQMPEMDGLEATMLIREAEREMAPVGGQGIPHIPIIAMTAHAMSGDREHCLSAGMDDYISKPISVRAVIEAIERVQRLKYASPSEIKSNLRSETRLRHYGMGATIRPTGI